MNNRSATNRLCLYLRTASHLKPTQVAFQILRRVFLSRPPQLGNDAIPLRNGMHLLCEPIPSKFSGSDTAFLFLNATKAFCAGGIDWKSAEMPKLWRYNLHYCDYLLDTDRSLQSKRQLISHWITHNPPGTADAWEPYTVSLRIVNWVKLFLQEPEIVVPEWLNVLYQQAAWLEKNIEYHILANHYLKNGKALFFAGSFFAGTDAERWLQKGLRILIEEADEQFLEDGGHYERSPMYHSICLEDYLDVLNLMTSNPGLISQEVVDRLTEKSNTALDFLNDVCLPDGEIPLFNDSALGIAPAPACIFEYARRITGYERPSLPTNLTIIEKAESGYFVIRNDGDMMIVDCGPVGPDYQPGHAHCDTLSYELALDGQRVVVDSGVYDYEAGARRRYSRSTKGHNTISVDGEEQSEIWGVFRVARRAYPIGATIVKLSGDRVRFEGMHDGFRRLSGKVMHKRAIEYDGRGTWTVRDEVTGTGKHDVESAIHLHPDYSTKQVNDCIKILKKDGKAIVRLELVGNALIRVEPGRYFPEFGIEHKNEVIVLSCSGTLPLEIGYRISKEC
ncbi:MAG: heparinase [Nitrospira sp.]|nr:MAG: heparinase [Nitrospira sp.]